MKASLYANLRETDPLETGYIGFVTGLEDEYYRELTSEIRKSIRTGTGATEWRWVPLSGVDQEMLDTHLYAQAAAVRQGWLTKSESEWEALRQRLEVPPAALDLFSPRPVATPVVAPPPPTEPQQPQRKRSAMFD